MAESTIQLTHTRSDDPPTFSLPVENPHASRCGPIYSDRYLRYICDNDDTMWYLDDFLIADWDNQDRDNFNPLWGVERFSMWRPHRDERRQKHRYKKDTRRSKNTGKRQLTKLV